MARERKSIVVGKVVDSVDGTVVELFYNPNSGKNCHEAKVGDQEMYAMEIDELRKLVLLALKARREMVWYPVIHLTLASGTSGTTAKNVIGLELERCRLAKRNDGRWQFSTWDNPEFNRQAQLPTNFEIGNTQQRGSWGEKERYLHYTEELWLRLTEIQAMIQRSKVALDEMIEGGPEAIVAGSMLYITGKTE
jgi:hypothetical protein